MHVVRNARVHGHGRSFHLPSHGTGSAYEARDKSMPLKLDAGTE